ncbi:Cytochrome c, mono-and diheme variants [Enhydrobacter aerosaccus]|uniref:Cytochrome c, mono-and diheme variants n=1 Tax=Enhydrobacter aerosaccus TaxID=225324 RepID=A0A1T4RWG2_9HYPH|nr:cytochrome c [Enhydrobacter aerosaccus]SKA20320.1 Cytochrome c, mono-and diheme variants [Enhydrobacter aerosaccus]
MLIRIRWLLAAVGLVLAVVAAVATGKAWPGAIAEVPPPAPGSFDKALVGRGEGLAHLGNCSTCHTADGGQPLAGGKALKTPFGTIFATNITPDPKTGIGRWSREAFFRSMREGLSRDGHHLYPAFPYDHFTHLTDSDLDALYAFLMTRPPVVAQAPENELIWPLQYRAAVAAWNLLYLQQGPMGSADRGQYLAEGLSHCGSCHTPRNKLGAEIVDRRYGGAWTQGWYAPPLNVHSPAARPWTPEDLFVYLRSGFSANHAAAAGPMSEVTRELAEAPEEDVRALAAYFAQQMSAAPAAKEAASLPDRSGPAGQAHPEGAVLFAGACANCHEAGAGMMLQGRPPLSWGTPLHEETPHNTLHVIVEGLHPAPGIAGPTMPAFGNDFTDAQLTEIAAYLRARYTDLPPWQDIPKAVADVRKGSIR